ncbi:uncharacterized protein SETTUDRAFT_139405 [Exserohilum turcica Et28A]|uniref:MFS general substrate transporter n=1 Tax=Exserohilum turcicum (strain 28A) TaxID=671987 RepID=R0K427_EXST2|nr:uncharacterized protein SETTUDRAFT_139405 [Exserohilum turcica Et28A]EOA83087.1 hypothetical protein SETTUDRAFT_139405 [Exserohilum turcica Et28A]
MSSATCSTQAAPLDDPHSEIELAPSLPYEPIALPRLASPVSTPSSLLAPSGLARSFSVFSKHGSRPKAASDSRSAKRESYNLTGTTFLITNDGRTLKLPVASESKSDPLNWGTWKTAGAMFSIVLFSAVSLTAAQAATVILESVRASFEYEAFLMVIDLTYINQRARAVSFMWCVAGCCGTSGVALVPVIADYGHNWRAFYLYWTIPLTISFIVSFALYPETYFKRPTVAFNGLILMQSATEKLTVYRDRDVDPTIYRDLPECPARTGFAGFRDRVGLSRSPFASWSSAGRCYVQMAYCAANPLMFWVFVASGFNSASMLFIGGTSIGVLVAPPYNFAPELLGTINMASGLGALLALPACWIIVCNALKRLSERNRGVLEAEHYLIAYILPVIFGAFSSMLYGAAVRFQWHPAALYLTYGTNGFSFVMLMTANTLWVAEAFPRWAAPALAVVIGGCFLLSFALSFALEPWIKAQGYLWVGFQLMCFQILGGLVAMPVAFWGKSMRQAIACRWADDRSGALRPL